MDKNNSDSHKTKYKYRFDVHVKSLEITIPYEGTVACKLLRGNKSTEFKKKLSSKGEKDRKYAVDEKMSIISTLEYNPHIGCWEEK